MFIIKLLSQHVSGIIMPIIRRTRVGTAAYGVLHWLCWLWLCGAGTRAVCTVKVTVRTVTFTVHTGSIHLSAVERTTPEECNLPLVQLQSRLIGRNTQTYIPSKWLCMTKAHNKYPIRVYCSCDFITITYLTLTHRTLFCNLHCVTFKMFEFNLYLHS